MCSASEKESLLDTSPSESKTKSDQIPEKDDCKDTCGGGGDGKGIAAGDANGMNDDGTLTAKCSYDGNRHSDIKHISGNLNADDLYAIPNKRKHQKHNNDSGTDNGGGGDGKVCEISSADEDDEEKGKKEDIDGIEDKDANKDLPPGWEKHEGKDYLIYFKIFIYIIVFYIDKKNRKICDFY